MMVNLLRHFLLLIIEAVLVEEFEVLLVSHILPVFPIKADSCSHVCEGIVNRSTRFLLLSINNSVAFWIIAISVMKLRKIESRDTSALTLGVVMMVVVMYATATCMQKLFVRAELNDLSSVSMYLFLHLQDAIFLGLL
jgi:hypothetical protein